MDRVLFIPSDHGGGMGHVSRCRYFAQRLHARGVPTAIVLERHHYHKWKDTDIQPYLLNTRGEKWLTYHLTPPFRDSLRLDRFITRRPVFVEFSGLAFQVPRDGYWNSTIVRRRLQQLITIVQQFKPTVLVGDAHFLTRILGAMLSLPVVQITRLAGFPPQPDFVWWRSVPREVIAPNAVQPFLPVLEKLGITVQRAEDLLRGDRYIVPAIPEIEPIPPRSDVVFVGSLSHSVPPSETTEKFPIVYVTIGGGAARGQEKQFFIALMKHLANQPYHVIISTAGRVAAKSLKPTPENVQIFDWVDGPRQIARSQLVIFHGGYGTLMETLLQGKPALVMPAHTEQEGNGARLQQLGIGSVALLHRPEALEPLPFRWRYGRYQMLGAFRLQVEWEWVKNQIKRLLSNPPSAKLQQIQQKLTRTADQTDFKKLIQF